MPAGPACGCAWNSPCTGIGLQGAVTRAWKGTTVTLTEEYEAIGSARSTPGEDLVMGRYRLGRRLGAGGFGAVHEAVDERLNRWVAVKVLHAEGAAPERA